MYNVMRPLEEMCKRNALMEEQQKVEVAHSERTLLQVATGTPQEEAGGEQPLTMETLQEGFTMGVNNLQDKLHVTGSSTSTHKRNSGEDQCLCEQLGGQGPSTTHNQGLRRRRS